MTVAPPPGPHGGDGPRLAASLGIPAGDVLDLSQNLNPCAPDVVSLVAAHAAAVRRYPDALLATAALAAAMGVGPDRLVLTNGGAEAIALVAAECPAGWFEEPEFGLYARHLDRRDVHGPRWRSNPQTPSGRLAPPDERAAVWDEAFYPLATGTWTRGDAGAVVVGSLTKLFACPGLRAGYVLAPDAAFAARVRARQPEWAFNAIACAVLPELLAQADLDGWSRSIGALREELTSRLLGAGVDTEPSDAPWLLALEAPGLREHLAQRGVLVRDTASFGIPHGVRVAVPDRVGLDRLGDALVGWPA